MAAEREDTNNTCAWALYACTALTKVRVPGTAGSTHTHKAGRGVQTQLQWHTAQADRAMHTSRHTHGRHVGVLLHTCIPAGIGVISRSGVGCEVYQIRRSDMQTSPWHDTSCSTAPMLLPCQVCGNMHLCVTTPGAACTPLTSKGSLLTPTTFTLGTSYTHSQ